jgi:hypothetical protein
MFVDVLLVLDELVLHLLFQVGPLGAQVWQAIDYVLHQVESVQVVLHPNVKGGGDSALLLVAPDVQIAIGPAIRQPVNQPGVSMKPEDDVLVACEKRVVIRFA